MKRLTVNFFILFLIVTLSSCSNNGTKEHDSVLEIDYKNLEEIKLSDYVDNIKVVKLATSDDVLIGEIVKVELFNNRIYVLDRLSNALFIFTDEGEIIYKLRKIGQGPGEYNTLFDFAVTDDGLYLSDIGNAILHYDKDFNFVRKIAHYSIAGNFVMNDEYFWIYREPVPAPYSQILMIDRNARTLDEFFPKKASEDGMNLASSNMFQKHESHIYFSPRYGNTVYKWTSENKWQEFITLSFGNKTFHGDINEYYSKMSEPDDADFPYIVRRDFFVFNNFLLCDFNIDFRLYCCFYDLKTKELKAGKVKNDLIPDYESWFPTSYNGYTSQSNNCLIECIVPEWIVSEEYGYYRGLCKLDESLKDLNEDDNPVLVIYEFK
ncbi:MAG: 6-bladed beta-propeller [Prevotellaceae bacterium]|nr:6-bladed beta-propeller [Prevotellaceae bacterium]